MICPVCGAREKHPGLADCLTALRVRVEELEARLKRAERREYDREQKEKRTW